MGSHEGILIAGAGGQGVLQLGRVIALAAIAEGKYATYYPSYGAEIRGGTANCSVVISDSRIASPVVTAPDCMIILNHPSFVKFSGKIAPGGLLIANSSLVRVPSRSGKNTVFLPATETAQELGDIRCANIVALGCYVRARRGVSRKAAETALRSAFGARAGAAALNLRALEKGMKYKWA